MQYVVFYGMMSGLTSEGIAHTSRAKGEEGAGGCLAMDGGGKQC